MKLISWNVNGLRACVGKGFMDFFREADADIFCIQESKLQEGQIELPLEGYHQYWNYADKKGLFRNGHLYQEESHCPVAYGIGIEEHDQGRPRDHSLEYAESVCGYGLYTKFPAVSLPDWIIV